MRLKAALLVVAALILVGCSGSGNVSQDDIQKNAKQLNDRIEQDQKDHPTDGQSGNAN